MIASALFATTLAKRGWRPLHLLILGGAVTAGVLDLHENHHLLVLLRLSELGESLPFSELIRRSELSQLKWMLGHVGFVPAGVALPASKRPLDRAFRWSLIVYQLPIGALAWTATDETAQLVLTCSQHMLARTKLDRMSVFPQCSDRFVADRRHMENGLT